jgi:CubicO group peptidase (beta-lactamase class C family)
VRRAEAGDAPGLAGVADDLAAWHADGLLPAAVLEVGTRAERLGACAVGVALEATFDLASLTKVLATGLLAATAVDRGRLDLDAPVRARLDEWRGEDRESVTVRDLLGHASGLPAHAPLFADTRGRRAMVAAAAGSPLATAPRARAIYSDLGFIVLGEVVARAHNGDLDSASGALLATVSDQAPRFRPAAALTLVPTGRSAWRGELPPGAVHDDNAAAMDGVAGHAGLFGTARGVGDVARAILAALSGASTPLGRPAIVRAFTRRSTVPGSSRALAWDTALPTSSCGSALSPRAIGHTGFTGTSLWIDPVLDLYAVLLTNRVAGRATSADMTTIRRAVHTRLGEAWRASRG